MSNRFDLEQSLLKCWNITDDIDVLLDRWGCMTEDQRLNFLIGIKEVYSQKFEVMWSTFEKCIQNKEF